MEKVRQKKIIFAAIFAMAGILLMQIPFTKIIGSNLKFSLFDFYGPIAGAFTGSVWGMLTVGAMQIGNWAYHGFQMDTATIIRFFPMLFAVLYFSKKTKLSLAVPALAMIAFWSHPEGRRAWYYALYWLIPIAAYFWHGKFILARALGATFTAHAVGGVLWIYAFNLKAAIWISLIPIVWKERGLMAFGITLTYLAANWALTKTAKKIPWLDFLILPGVEALKQK